MNKLLISTVIAGGLLLLDAPEAAAHDKRDRQHSSPRYDNADKHRHGSYRRGAYNREGYRRDHYVSKHMRVKHMPRWLKRDRAFRHWLERSHLRRDRWLSWNQLFEIYRWELSYNRHRHRHYRH